MTTLSSIFRVYMDFLIHTAHEDSRHLTDEDTGAGRV